MFVKDKQTAYYCAMDRSTAQEIHYTLSATELPEYSGDDVRRIRIDLGMNQEEFASYLGYGSGKNKISSN
jgi:DNA-binding transcriptional regulator YiaG